MKRVLTFLTFALALLLTACSYVTNFVIINATDQAVELRYRIKDSPRDPVEMAGAPRKTAAEKVGDGDSDWRLLAPGEYTLDAGARVITVRLMPHEAVMVARLTNYRGHDSSHAGAYAIEEIHLSGASGEVKLQGDEARRGFVRQSDNLYTLTYK